MRATPFCRLRYGTFLLFEDEEPALSVLDDTALLLAVFPNLYEPDLSLALSWFCESDLLPDLSLFFSCFCGSDLSPDFSDLCELDFSSDFSVLPELSLFLPVFSSEKLDLLSGFSLFSEASLFSLTVPPDEPPKSSSSVELPVPKKKLLTSPHNPFIH